MLFVTFTTGNYADMTRNFIKNFENVLVPCEHSLILVCTDKSSYDYFKTFSSIWLTIEFRCVNNEGAVSTYNTPSFNKLMTYKPFIVLDILDKTREMYWVDSDIVFFKNPEPFIREINKDIVFQQDNDRDHDRLCAGNFYVKNTPSSINFIKSWISRINEEPHIVDQDTLNKLVRTEYGDISRATDFSGGVFPPKLFQRGIDAFKYGWSSNPDKVCIHANFMEGLETKKRALASIGAWNIPHL